VPGSVLVSGREQLPLLPEPRVSMAEHPERALSQLAHHNVEPILAPCVCPGYTSLTLPGNPFLFPSSVPAGADFGLLYLGCLADALGTCTSLALSCRGRRSCRAFLPWNGSRKLEEKWVCTNIISVV
jgi:hypothetical protein